MTITKTKRDKEHGGRRGFYSDTEVGLATTSKSIRSGKLRLLTIDTHSTWGNGTFH